MQREVLELLADEAVLGDVDGEPERREVLVRRLRHELDVKGAGPDVHGHTHGLALERAPHAGDAVRGLGVDLEGGAADQLFRPEAEVADGATLGHDERPVAVDCEQNNGQVGDDLAEPFEARLFHGHRRAQ